MPQRTQWLDRTLTITTLLAALLVGSCSEKPVVAPNPDAQFSMGGGDDKKDSKREDDNAKDKDRCKESDKEDKGPPNKDSNKDHDNGWGNDDKCDDDDGKGDIVKVTPVVVVLKPGQTQQLKLHLKGKCTDASQVTFTSSKPSVATVSPTGLVTAVGVGTATITATCKGDTDTVTVTVLPSREGGRSGGNQQSNADPSQLPEANGQRPPPGTYGRTLSSGQTYRDPVTNVIVLKVTDAATPRANILGTDKGYSEGGPIISQPWTGADGDTYYTFTVTVEGEQYLVDVNYDTLVLSNWRRVFYASEIGFAFSLNPATPRIAYLVDPSGMSVNRYNTATNTVENGGAWPWTPPGGAGRIDWLQNNLNDTWFVAMLTSTNTVVAYRPSDRAQRAFAEPLTDEPHIDRELPYVYISTDDDVRQNIIGDLETGTTRIPENSVYQSDDHEAPLRGMVTGLSNFARDRNFYYDVRNDTTVEYTDADNVVGNPADWHIAGQWVFGNGIGPAQWFVIDAYGAPPDPEADIQSGMIGIVRPNPFSARLVAVHDSQNGQVNYQAQPQTTISPDGKLVLWSSDMGGQPRTDVFLAKLPVN